MNQKRAEATLPWPTIPPWKTLIMVGSLGRGGSDPLENWPFVPYL